MSGDWSEQLKKICEKRGEDVGKFCRAVKINLFSEVMSTTRADTGRLRGNWQLRDGSPASGEIDRVIPDGQEGRIDPVVSRASEDGVTYLTNNLPYAVVWEERDAMVGRSVARLSQIINEEAGKIK